VKFYNLNDSIFGIKTNEKMLELEKKYETEKKEQENKMLQLKNKQDKEKAELNNYKQNLIIGLVSSISILLLIVAVIVGRSLKITKLQKKIIENQKIQVEEHQKEIIDSINYAKRIQYTLLAHENFLNTHLPQHFVFFLPKDIVSGDFYWAIKKDDDLYLAVGDCTGHGVPGAFMSLLNISLLNEAITELNIREPNKVLDFVRDKLIQTMEGSKDGMDAILIRIRKNHIQYAAAHNRPVLIRNNELIELSADKMPVGKGENNNAFTLHELNLEKNDMLYLFTDGYADQFGGPKGKKFKYSRLHKLFLEQHELNISEKRNNLESTFHNWKRDLEQVDDVCVMGIKFE
jgi:serine phosphatase RsbU (regulator of sigma subunit)